MNIKALTCYACEEIVSLQIMKHIILAFLVTTPEKHLLHLNDNLGFISLEHLREELLAPESGPGPQLPDEDSPGQVGLDLRQQLRGLLVQPVGVRQQPVVHDLLLRDERSILIRNHILWCHFPASCARRKAPKKKTRLLCPLSDGAPQKLEDIICCVQPVRRAEDRRSQAGEEKCVTLIELRKAPERRTEPL